MNEKYLLWWVLRAIDSGYNSRQDLTEKLTWTCMGAPEWVWPAVVEADKSIDQKEPG